MKMKYGSPNILFANGTINLTVSQEAELGFGASTWEEFWYNNEETINEVYPDFDVTDQNTWPEGFVFSDPTTWEVLVGDPFGD